jgi:hypothetical protein
MVRIHPDPPADSHTTRGAIAQLGERLLCKQEVIGSIPIGSTSTAVTPRLQRRAPSRWRSSVRLHEHFGCSLTIWNEGKS